MDNCDNGGCAFPNDGAWANGHPEGGMSLRDYFAGIAYSVIFSDAEAVQDWRRNGKLLRYSSYVAGLAYQAADAMLAERAKGGG